MLHWRKWIILGGALVALWLLALPGIVGSDDILNSLYRLYALEQSWQTGMLYPRWSPLLAYGYGSPLFHYYPPLPSYLGLLLRGSGLSLIGALKGVHLLALVAGGLGVYAYSHTLHKNRNAALLTALLYLFAPYQLLDIYQRGATAEACVLGLLPWLFYAIHQLHSTSTRGWLLVTSALIAALCLTHTSLALFSALALASYVWTLHGWRLAWSRLRWEIAATLLGLGLSTFFWVPALGERNFVNLQGLTGGFYDPVNNLLPWRQLLQAGWPFDYAAPQGFRWGWLAALITLISVVRLLTQPSRRWVIFHGALIGLALLLQMDFAAPLWANVPLVRFIQFPWRLLTFVTLSSVLLIGGAVATATKRQGWLIIMVALLLISYASAGLWPGYLAAWRAGHFTADQLSQGDMDARGRLGFELYSDYQPVGIQVAMRELSNPRPQPPPVQLPALATLPKFTIQRATPTLLQATVITSQSFPLLFHQFYFPGWQVLIDSQPVQAYAQGEAGLLAVDLPAGEHTVVLQLGQTPLQNVGQIIAGLALLIWWWLACGRRWRGWLALCLLIGLLIGWQVWARQDRQFYGPVQANLADRALLTGYALDQARYHPGETI